MVNQIFGFRPPGRLFLWSANAQYDRHDTVAGQGRVLKQFVKLSNRQSQQR